MPIPTARILFKSYLSQMLAVCWACHVSHKFAVTNGVRQGVYLTPILSMYRHTYFSAEEVQPWMLLR